MIYYDIARMCHWLYPYNFQLKTAKHLHAGYPSDLEIAIRSNKSRLLYIFNYLLQLKINNYYGNYGDENINYKLHADQEHANYCDNFFV